MLLKYISIYNFLYYLYIVKLSSLDKLRLLLLFEVSLFSWFFESVLNHQPWIVFALIALCGKAVVISIVPQMLFCWRTDFQVGKTSNMALVLKRCQFQQGPLCHHHISSSRFTICLCISQIRPSLLDTSVTYLIYQTVI